MSCYCGVGFIWSKGYEARAQRALLEQSVPTSFKSYLYCSYVPHLLGDVEP